MIERFLPIAASQHAADIDRVLLSVHWHMLLQAIAWGALFVFALVRFRQRAQRAASYRGLKPLIPTMAIGLVIVGDAVLLATAALPVWYERTRPPDPRTAPLELHVVAEQFAWNIHYPGPDERFGATTATLISASNPLGIDRASPDAADDIGLVNQLVLPLGRPVIVHLTSRDVVHSFTLNEMRVRQDANPGMVVRTWFTPIVTGRWDIACSQLCGLGHFRMRGEYRVLSEAEWQRWLAAEVALLAG